MTESPAEFLEPLRRDEFESPVEHDGDPERRQPRASEQLDTPDEPYGDG